MELGPIVVCIEIINQHAPVFPSPAAMVEVHTGAAESFNIATPRARGSVRKPALKQNAKQSSASTLQERAAARLADPDAFSEVFGVGDEEMMGELETITGEVEELTVTEPDLMDQDAGVPRKELRRKTRQAFQRRCS